MLEILYYDQNFTQNSCQYTCNILSTIFHLKIQLKHFYGCHIFSIAQVRVIKFSVSSKSKKGKVMILRKQNQKKQKGEVNFCCKYLPKGKRRQSLFIFAYYISKVIRLCKMELIQIRVLDLVKMEHFQKKINS